MISPKTSPPFLATIHRLCQAPFVFHLCGSRFFGDFRIDSDWDFIADHSDELVEWLNQNGFTLRWDRGSKYKDVNTLCCYDCQDVQVILCVSVARRLEARKSFLPLDPFQDSGLDRKDTETWNKIYSQIP